MRLLSPHKLLFHLLLALLVVSCGVEVGNPKNPDEDDDTNNTSVLEEDPAAAAGLISIKIDDSVDTVSSTEQQREGLSLGLVGGFASAMTDNTVSVECDDETENQVEVTRTASGEVTVRRRAKDGFVKIVVDGDAELTNTWKGDDEFIRCNANKTKARIGFRSLEELTLDASFSRDDTTTVTKLVLGTLVRQRSVKAEGTRSFSWKRTDPSEDGVASVAGTVSSSVERTITLTTPISGQTEISTSLSMDEDDPFSTIADYDSDTGLLVKKTIKSGTQIGVQLDGTKIVTTYDNVVLVREEGCQPQSGSISGEIFNDEEAEEPFATYTVEFDGTESTIVFDSGETATYAADACEFER